MSFKAEVNTAGDPPDAYTSNGLRFATEEEGKIYARDLMMRWTAVNDFRVVPSDEPVNRVITVNDVTSTFSMETV